MNSARDDPSEGGASVVRLDGDRIRLSGELRTRDAAAIWSALRSAARDLRAGTHVELDMSAVPSVEGDVMALLVDIRGQLAARGSEVALTGMCEPVAKLARLYGADRPNGPVTRAPPEDVVAQVGAATLAHVARLEETLGFLGSLVLAARGRKRRARATHWGQVLSLVEKAGAEAMVIVCAVVFVVGFIFSYSTANTFVQIGERLLSASTIGRGMSREIAPVITAFIISGRSGAAYTAEIGSMKIDHEIDALRTLGLEPFAWLVVPRMVALLVVVPALTIVAEFFGFAGGALVGVTSLGLRLPVYVHALTSAISPWDVLSGVIKAAAFGLAIALISCQQGFAVSGGPGEVGRRTTSAVVAGIFFTVAVDAILTIIYESFGG